jgi:hypothetical protein
MMMMMMMLRLCSFHGKFNSYSHRVVIVLLQLLLLSQLSFIYIITDATTVSLSRDLLSNNNTNHTTTASLSNSSSSSQTTNDIRYEILHNMTIEYRNRFQPSQDGTTTTTTTSSSSNSISSDSILQPIPPEQQHVRNFFRNIYNRIFTPTIRCNIGLKSTCICQEDDLRRAILRSGTSFDNPTSIVICLGTITLTDHKPMNITNKSFFIGCTGNTATNSILRQQQQRTCDISGNRQQRIFYGNPIQLFLQNIRLISGNAILQSNDNDDDNHNNNTNFVSSHILQKQNIG